MTVYYFNGPGSGPHAGDIGYAQNYAYINGDGHLQQVQPGEAGPGSGDQIDGLDNVGAATNGSISAGLVVGALIAGSASLTTKAGQGTLDADGGTITVNGDADGVNAENGGTVKVNGSAVSAGAGSGGTTQVSTVTGAADAEDGGEVTVGTSTGGVFASNGGTVSVGTLVDGLNAEGNVGSVDVSAGGTVTVGSVTTDGTDPVADSVDGGTLQVGTYGSGTATFNLSIAGGGVATIGTIAAPVSITISGAGSHLAGQDALTIGTTGAGNVSVAGGATQTFTSVSAGIQASGNGGIQSAGGQLSVTGDVVIGVAGSGSVSAGGSGALVKIGGALKLAQQVGATGYVFASGGGTVEDDGATTFGPGRTYAILTDAGSTWKWTSATVTIGNGYSGIGVYDGALLDASSSDVTFLGTPSSSSLPYSGLSVRGTKLNGSTGATGSAKFKSLTIGGGGRGYVHVYQGGSMQISGALSIGTLAASTLSGPGLDVNGTGATLSAKSMVLGSETAAVDAYGVWSYTNVTSGSFGVSSGGYASIGKMLAMVNSVSIFGGGAMEVGGNHGLGGTGGPAADTLQVDAGGSITGHSSIMVGSFSGGGYTGTILNNGLVEVQQGTMVLNAGTIAAPTATTGSFQIDDKSTLEVTGSVAAGNLFNFNGGYETTLQLDDPKDFHGTLGDLAPGDTILLPGSGLAALGYDTLAYTAVSGSTLTLTFSSNNTLTYQIAGLPADTAFDTRTLYNQTTKSDDVALTLEPTTTQVATGSAGGTPASGTPTRNVYLDSLIEGWAKWNPSAPITYWFGNPGDVASAVQTHGTIAGVPYDASPSPLDNWTQSEEDAFQNALATIQAETGLTFQMAGSAASANVDFWLNPQLSSYLGVAAAGVSETPADDPSGHVWSVYDDSSWLAHPSLLYPGAQGFKTIIHEIGHTLGLSHPFNGGNNPDATPFPGVTAPTGSYGTNNQNQAIFSMMSYNEGWIGQPVTVQNWGRNITPGAFDIAALQALYGKNGNSASGSNTYQLQTLNQVGVSQTDTATGWACIYDTGGNDTISNAGSSLSATIDLRPAPLTGPNAGGYVSHDEGIQGGFTIANGVTIENAVGGNGDDLLIGSSGTESFKGNGGNDRIIGGTGTNTAIFSGNFSNYAISQNNGALTVVDTRSGSPDGTDTLQNIQLLQFADKSVASSELAPGPSLTILPFGDTDIVNAAAAAGTFEITGVSQGLAGQAVTVTFNGASYVGTIGSDGSFEVTVPTNALTLSALTDGAYMITAAASAKGASSSTTATETFQVHQMRAGATGVTPSQTTPATAGQTVTLTVAFSAPVTVVTNSDEDSPGPTTPSPTLSLNDGGTATFDAAASTTTALVFDYTVGASDQTPDLAVTSFNANNSALIDAYGNQADTSGAIAATGLKIVSPAVLTVTGTTDYRGQTLSGLTKIQFAAAADATAIFNASQFNGTQIASNATILGDAHANTLAIAATGTFSAASLSFSSWSANDTLALTGSAAADTLTGGLVGTRLEGGGGGDRLTGGAGNDYILVNGTGASDTIDGGGGSNLIDLSEAAGSGQLTVNFLAGTVTRGAQTDASFTHVTGVVLSSAAANVLGASTAGATTTTYAGVGASDTVYGEGGTDYLYGSSGADTLQGSTGTAFLIGGGGHDILRGGTGLNVETGGAGGFDALYGGGTQNYLYGSAAAGSTAILVGSTAAGATDRLFSGGGGTDYVYDEGQTAILIGAASGGTEYAYGGTGTTILTGQGGTDILVGQQAAGGGADYLFSGSNTDIMVEGSGQSFVYGASGTDYIYGGTGSSSVYGGSGTDFIYTDAGNQYLSAGTGNTFFEETAAHLTSGRFDQIDKFKTASASTGNKGTFIYMPAADASATQFADANGGTLVHTPAVSGSGYADIFVSGVDAATVRKQTVFSL